MSTETEQRTLTGKDADRVECDYYDGCTNPALFIDEILHYGEGEKPVRMCESCADERRENPNHEVQRLKPEDRYKGDDSGLTVHVVVTNYADDPHPHVELVTADAAEAESLMDDCRSVIDRPTPIAWKHYEREVRL